MMAAELDGDVELELQSWHSYNEIVGEVGAKSIVAVVCTVGDYEAAAAAVVVSLRTTASSFVAVVDGLVEANWWPS